MYVYLHGSIYSAVDIGLSFFKVFLGTVDFFFVSSIFGMVKPDELPRKLIRMASSCIGEEQVGITWKET